MVRNGLGSLGLLLGVAGIGGCTTVRHVAPAEYFADNSPAVVWVTYTNNTIVQVADPEIRRDTLRGTLQGARVKIPLSEIQSVQAKVRDHRKTAILVAAVGVAVVSSVYVGFVGKSSGGASIDCTGDEVTKHPMEHPECFN
jgi:hypothetical protein